MHFPVIPEPRPTKGGMRLALPQNFLERGLKLADGWRSVFLD